MANKKTNKNPRAAEMVNRLISPLEDFLALETASGIILIAATALALLWANSPFHHSYEALVEMPISFSMGAFSIEKSFHHWVNDGLMVLFFFVVGLEIKRELILGELSTTKKATLPMVAAAGGMVVPALIYTGFNLGTPALDGWGIPMATDIAFAVGIMALMSRKVPFSLKIFLLALAIVDDLGAVLVIALFYTEKIHTQFLALSFIMVFFTAFLKAAGIRSILTYSIVGVITWFAVLKSGVHATVAGVVLGLLTPPEPFMRKKEFPKRFRNAVDDVAKDMHQSEDDIYLDQSTFHKLEHIHQLVLEAKSPLDRLIHRLHPYVSYIIMPVFAFANAGVRLGNVEAGSFFTGSVPLGIIFGLLIGKPVGIFASSYLAVRGGIARLPQGVTWHQILAMGFLAGIGFTMALFINTLALGGSEYETFSKLSILLASFVSGCMGMGLLAFSQDVSRRKKKGA